jgi:hypothetical protein
MFNDGYVEAIAYKDNIKRAERKAALNHRTRHMKAPETKVAIAVINTVLSAVLGIFLR